MPDANKGVVAPRGFRAVARSLERKYPCALAARHVCTTTATASSASAAVECFQGLVLSGTRGGAGGVGGLLFGYFWGWDSGWLDDSFCYGYDANGNVTDVYQIMSGWDGYGAAHYEYDAFGNLVRERFFSNGNGGLAPGNKNPFKFSTKWHDNAAHGDYAGIIPYHGQLVYYGQRWYHQGLGRFLNRDPIGEAGGLNLYAFCGNDGVNYVDIAGLLGVQTPPGYGQGHNRAPRGGGPPPNNRPAPSFSYYTPDAGWRPRIPRCKRFDINARFGMEYSAKFRSTDGQHVSIQGWTFNGNEIIKLLRSPEGCCITQFELSAHQSIGTIYTSGFTDKGAIDVAEFVAAFTPDKFCKDAFIDLNFCNGDEAAYAIQQQLAGTSATIEFTQGENRNIPGYPYTDWLGGGPDVIIRSPENSIPW